MSATTLQDQVEDVLQPHRSLMDELNEGSTPLDVRPTRYTDEQLPNPIGFGRPLPGPVHHVDAPTSLLDGTNSLGLSIDTTLGSSDLEPGLLPYRIPRRLPVSPPSSSPSSSLSEFPSISPSPPLPPFAFASPSPRLPPLASPSPSPVPWQLSESEIQEPPSIEQLVSADWDDLESCAAITPRTTPNATPELTPDSIGSVKELEPEPELDRGAKMEEVPDTRSARVAYAAGAAAAAVARLRRMRLLARLDVNVESGLVVP